MALTGKLMDGNDAYHWIADALSGIGGPIDICSAFLRSEALISMLQGAPNPLSGRILVRWRLNDFLAGASDFEAYEIALSHGMAVYMRLDFHGKVYSIPPHGVIVGSANATLSGLGLTHASNAEICTLADCDEGNQQMIDGLYASATLVDRAFLSDLKGAYEQNGQGLSCDQEWPGNIVSRLSKKRAVTSLLVDECLWGGPNWLVSASTEVAPNMLHDQALLGIFPEGAPFTLSNASLKVHLRGTAIYHWLVASIERNGGEIYFGQLSALLHSSLADDPSPSRQGVKQLLQNLLEWVSALKLAEMAVDRPRHSQRIRLLGGID